MYVLVILLVAVAAIICAGIVAHRRMQRQEEAWALEKKALMLTIELLVSMGKEQEEAQRKRGIHGVLDDMLREGALRLVDNQRN